MPNTIYKARKQYFDVLNILSCFAVIMLHNILFISILSPTFNSTYTICVDILCRFAVPIFIMISGANLFNYHQRYSTATFFKKRITRVVIPYLLWNFIYFYTNCKNQNIPLSDFNFETITTHIIYPKSNIALWFLPVIMSLYMLMPVFTNFTRPTDRRFLWNLVIVYFLIGGIICPIIKIIQIPYINYNILYNGILYILILKYLMQTRTVSRYKVLAYTVCFISSYMIYYKLLANVEQFHVYTSLIYAYPIYILLGYLLSTQEISRKQRIAIYILAIICMFIRYINMQFYFHKYNAFLGNIGDYTYFIAILQSCAVFLWCKYSTVCKKINTLLLQTLASCTFGIYLIHIMIISILYALIAQEDWQTLTPICTYMVSLLIVLLLRKIIFLKYLFGG